MSKYVCIECGACAPELYKDYNGGIIKISHCVSNSHTLLHKFVNQS